MHTPITNARTQRKSLAAEIERLDRVVEALEDGLKTTVAQVVREAVFVAVQQTIQAIVAEALAQPELLRQLANLTAPPSVVGSEPASPTSQKSSCAGLRRKLGHVWWWLRSGVCDTWNWTGSKLPGVRQRMREAGQMLWRNRGIVAMSALIGLSLGAGGYLSGPVVSSYALGLCSSALSAAVFVLSPFVRLWKSLQGQQG